ncbi:nucleolar complex protein 2 homolog [Striga asiatica]|uniref:Nucleolar complex protein 2 homolog n=1 Tax=Striga asiatica TaxID=4170 RepID=A0A5A7R0R6_STRAF|nr:nucleolar complex protein 2 homolog [Striga asiatica]
MGKLGKKARKFAKKHLQSVLRNRRKTKALFKKKARKGAPNDTEEQLDNQSRVSNGRNTESEDVGNISLDAVFMENATDEVEDASDSDGYLSEDSGCPYDVETETDETPEGEIARSTFSAQNKELQADLVIQKKKLDRLSKKDPEFSKFLESFSNSAEEFQNEDEYSDEDESSDQEDQGEDNPSKDQRKLLTNRVINTWCQMIKEERNQSAFINLLNAYRTVSHYGSGSIGHKIENSETFCNILVFTLTNADDLFRGLTEISSSKSTKETLLELKKTSKWKDLKPLIKSYLRSSLYLLNQATDSDILVFAITRLRASLIFFFAFPSLIDRLIKAAVHLWATSGEILSSASFLIIRDIAAMSSSNYFDTCLSKVFAAFISFSRVLEISDIRQMQLMRDCVVELCSIDVQKSSVKALASLSQLAKILSWGVQTKKKEALGKICSWEYVNCIDVWVRFTSTNISDYELQSLVFMTTQVINGVAHMFPGPRYFPLRLKCVEWLNCLASSSGNFIPLASLVLDILEYKVGKEGKTAGNAFDVISLLKLPKHYLKTRSFQDECFHLAVEQLSSHFAQWCYHISFPDLATIPLARLRKIHEIMTIESLRRTLKRFIDQVEQNVDYVQTKRDEVSFSPHDHQSVDSFLQLEKSSLNAPFTQYYKSMLDKAAERKLHKSANISAPKQKKSKRKKAEPKQKAQGVKENQQTGLIVENGTAGNKRRKSAT